MNRKQRLGGLESHDACGEAVAWIRATPGQPGHLWRQVPRGEWLLWMHEKAGLPWEDRAPVVYEIADRAVRVVAPRALYAAGLRDEARALRALAPIVDRETAEAARSSAWAAGAAADAAARSSAEAAAGAAARSSAEAAAWAAAWAAARAAGAAAWAAEQRRHATMVRRHIRWADIERAIEEGTP